MPWTAARVLGLWVLAALTAAPCGAMAEDRLPAAVPFGWPNAIPEFRAGPTGLPGGTLAAPWRATNANSFDTNGFGITDGPVLTCGSGVLADGRAAIAFEQWAKVGGGGAGGPGGIEPHLCVRAWDGKGWMPVGQEISLSPTGKPLSFSGAELRWPVDPTAGKALPYWHGSCRVLWGQRVFWYGAFWTATALRIEAVDDGGRTDQLTMLWGADRNDRSEHAMGFRVWRMREGRWVETRTVKLKHDAMDEKTLAGVKTRIVEQALTMDVDTTGHVYLCTARQVLTEKAGTFTRAYPTDVLRYASTGEEKPTVWALDPLEMAGSPFIQAPIPQERGFGEPAGHMVMWARGAFPLLGLEYRAARAKGEVGPIKLVWRYWKLADHKWTVLWEGKDQDRASEFGVPMGQRPDGYPVWWYQKGEQPGKVFSGHPHFAEWQMSAAGAGKFVEERLPEFVPGTSTQLWPGQTSTWHNGQPLLAVVGVSRHSQDATRTQQRLHAALWTRRDGQWVNAGGALPAYTRPFHGGHDGISSAQAVASAQGEVILLWCNDLPVHGPPGTFAAARALPPK